MNKLTKTIRKAAIAGTLVSSFILHPSSLAAGISTNKVFMLNANNALPPDETNFFQVNGSLLNAAVTGGGGGAATNATLLNGVSGAATLSAANVSGPSAGLNLSVSGGSLNLTLTNVAGGITNSNTSRVTLSNDVSIAGDGLTWPLSVTPKAAFSGLANFGGYVWFQITGASLDSGAITTDGGGNMYGNSYTGAHVGLGSGLTNSAGNGYVDHTVTNALNTVVGNVGAAVTNWANGAFQPLSPALTTLAGKNGSNVTNVTSTAGRVSILQFGYANASGVLNTNARVYQYCSMTNGSPNLTGTNCAFTAADVFSVSGRTVEVTKAGTGGTNLSSYIVTFVSATNVVLADAAGATVTANAQGGIGNDDTPALIAAMSYTSNNPSCSICDMVDGGYWIDGQFFMEPFASNVVYAQILFPSRTNAPAFTTGFQGAASACPAGWWSPQGNHNPPPTNGVILYSLRSPPAGSTAYVIGVPSAVSNAPANFVGFSQINAVLKNLTVSTYDNPATGAISLAYASLCDVDHVIWRTGVIEGNMTYPSHSVGRGFQAPLLNNQAQCHLGTLWGSGYYIDFEYGDHTEVENLYCQMTAYALFSSGNQLSASIGHFCTQGFTYGLVGGGPNSIYIGNWEYQPSSFSGGEAAFNTTDVILDAGNNIKGMIASYHIQGTSTPMVVSGAANVQRFNLTTQTWDTTLNAAGGINITGGTETNQSLTGSSLVLTGSSKQIVSLPNGAGVLTNDGSGNFSYVAVGGAGSGTITGGDGVLETGTSGSLALGNAGANTVWGNATGSTGAPAYTGSPVVTNVTTITATGTNYQSPAGTTNIGANFTNMTGFSPLGYPWITNISPTGQYVQFTSSNNVAVNTTTYAIFTNSAWLTTYPTGTILAIPQGWAKCLTNAAGGNWALTSASGFPSAVYLWRGVSGSPAIVDKSQVQFTGTAATVPTLADNEGVGAVGLHIYNGNTTNVLTAVFTWTCWFTP